MGVPRRVRKLYQIRKPSRNFETAFNQFYDDVRHEGIVEDLRGAELEEFLDFLDEVLQLEELNPEIFRKALHSLWRICSKRGVLPKSHIISEGLSRTGDAPFASGGYADVWVGELAWRKPDIRKVCIKRMKTPSDEKQEKYEQAWREEVSVWMRLKHPNVVQCLGATADPPQIIVDWMPNGEVMRCVQRNPEADRLHLVLGVTEGLHYLHSHGVVHGDLKPRNILVNAKGDACLSDFGLSIVTCSKGPTGREDPTARGHSSVWAAPETLNYARISKEADVFSYGLVVIEIFKGESPWGQATALQVMTKITLGERPVRPEGTRAPGLTTKLWNSLTRCWHANPEDRITILEMLELLLSGSRSQPAATVGRTDSQRDTSTISDDEQRELRDPSLPPRDYFPEYTGGLPQPGTVLSAPTIQRPRSAMPPDTAGSSNGTPSIHTTGQRRPESIVSPTRRAMTFSTIRKSIGPGKARGLQRFRALLCYPDTNPKYTDQVLYPPPVNRE